MALPKDHEVAQIPLGNCRLASNKYSPRNDPWKYGVSSICADNQAFKYVSAFDWLTAMPVSANGPMNALFPAPFEASELA
jgi:hypothetical protein